MNKKRQREISYIKLSKNDSGYSLRALPIHAKSLAKHFRSNSVSFARQAVDSEELLQLSGGGDDESLRQILQEWKEKYVSGGEQYF